MAVLGAAGIIAPAIVRDLAESEEVAELLLLDLDERRVAAVAEAHGCGKARAAAADARSGLADSLVGVDVLVNAASYRVNLDAMRACLDAGCHYLDLGGLYHVTNEQLALSEQFEAADLLAVLGIGSSPGKTNVMAVRACAELGGRADELDVVAAGRDLDPPEGPSYPYSPRTLVDELTLAPMAVRDGRPVALQPLEDGGTVMLPEPLGNAPTIYTLHSEVLTFPDSFGCSRCHFRLSLAPAVLEQVRELVNASDAQLAAAGAEARPASAATVSVHRVIARGEGGGVMVTAVTHGVERWGMGGGVVSTATPASATVRLIARGAITARGALPPERCISPDDLFPELEARGCEFDVQVATAA